MTQSKNSNKFQSKKINCRNNIQEKVIKNKIIDTIKYLINSTKYSVASILLNTHKIKQILIDK